MCRAILKAAYHNNPLNIAHHAKLSLIHDVLVSSQAGREALQQKQQAFESQIHKIEHKLELDAACLRAADTMKLHKISTTSLADHIPETGLGPGWL